MRITALAFALTLMVGPALACSYGTTASTKSAPVTTAEAPIQTPVPSEVRSGS